MMSKIVAKSLKDIFTLHSSLIDKLSQMVILAAESDLDHVDSRVILEVIRASHTDSMRLMDQILSDIRKEAE